MKFLYKLLLNGIVVVLFTQWFTNATFWQSIISAIVFSGLAYVVGDQLILRRSNNTVATIADAGLAFVFFWVVSNMFDWTMSFGELVILTLAIGIAEIAYHRFLASGAERATE
ncbi:DUF2512 family protein [Bacillus horti]|uniref:DUF2512 family protein n=1 Tax=Caldalkalibacillus horti TaxID=77523 RepID=A0ABT9W0N0_9BACI|nr:DUF2512 family protein [Bacillus horti]MDQ0166782.1 hypothetical protein [Bacillus horti]